MASRIPFPTLGTADEKPADGKSVAGNYAGMRSPVRPPTSGDPYQTALEKDFPRILTAIQSLWGYPELNAYFRKLTLDNRGDREGFPKEVWEEIFALLHLHQMIVPEPLY
jgi:hypothetical protein